MKDPISSSYTYQGFDRCTCDVLDCNKDVILEDVSKPQLSSNIGRKKVMKTNVMYRNRYLRSTLCSVFVASIFLFLFCATISHIHNSLLMVSAEDFDTNSNYIDDLDDFSNQDYTTSENNWNNDKSMDILFSLLFGFCITFFGTIVGYFSMKEDKLMQKYLKNGYTVSATIESAELLQERRMWHNLNNEHDHNNSKYSNSLFEYLVRCDYVDILSDNYEVRVQKTFKIRHSDIVPFHREQTIITPLNTNNVPMYRFNENEHQPKCLDSSLDCSDQAVIVNVDNGNSSSLNHDDDLDNDTASGPIIGLMQNHSRPIISNTVNDSAAIIGGNLHPDNYHHSSNRMMIDKENQLPPNLPKYPMALDVKNSILELCILNGFPKSGYPKKVLERKCGLIYRLMTVGFTVCTFSLAGFCVLCAVESKVAMSQQNNSNNDEHLFIPSWYYGIGIFSLYGILMALFVFCLLDSIINQVLHDEYLVSGEFGPILRNNNDFDDDTTISTVKGDRFLTVTRPIMLDMVSMLSFDTSHSYNLQ